MLHHISMSTFDHSLLGLCFPSISNQPHGRGKVFRFEVMWLRDPQCDVVVEEAWQEGLYKTGGSPFVNYMESYRDRLGILE